MVQMQPWSEAARVHRAMLYNVACAPRPWQSAQSSFAVRVYVLRMHVVRCQAHAWCISTLHNTVATTEWCPLSPHMHICEDGTYRSSVAVGCTMQPATHCTAPLPGSTPPSRTWAR